MLRAMYILNDHLFQLLKNIDFLVAVLKSAILTQMIFVLDLTYSFNISLNFSKWEGFKSKLSKLTKFCSSTFSEKIKYYMDIITIFQIKPINLKFINLLGVHSLL